MYVIQNTITGEYVAKPSLGSIYVRDLHKARMFSTPERAAQARKPDTEMVIAVADIVGDLKADFRDLTRG